MSIDDLYTVLTVLFAIVVVVGFGTAWSAADDFKKAHEHKRWNDERP